MQQGFDSVSLVSVTINFEGLENTIRVNSSYHMFRKYK